MAVKRVGSRYEDSPVMAARVEEPEEESEPPKTLIEILDEAFSEYRMFTGQGCVRCALDRHEVITARFTFGGKSLCIAHLVAAHEQEMRERHYGTWDRGPG